MPLSNLAQRSITGFFFGLIIISSCFAPLIWQVVLYGIIMILGLNEFISFFKEDKSVQLDSISAYFLQGLIYLIISSTFFFDIDIALTWVIVPIIFLVIINELWRNIGNPILNVSTLLFGVGYTLIPFIMIISLGKLSIDEQVNFPLVLGMYLLIWTNDTFAYFSGRFFGKNPLFSRISPKKTWEGTIGGVVFTIGVSLILAATTKEFSYSFWLVAALITAPSAILGDLLESLFKRSVNVKDSGSILPGHGGILDRFDAVLFTVPFFYFWSLFYLHYIAS